MVRMRPRMVKSRLVYVLLLIGAGCLIGFFASMDRFAYPRVGNAFAFAAGASFLAALVVTLTLLLRHWGHNTGFHRIKG